jgi:hypothetical protein
MRNLTLLLLLGSCLCWSSCKSTGKQGSATNDPEKEEWIQLFNGKDLNDWIVKIRGHEVGENHGNTFRVKDGLLTVNYDQYTDFDSQFGHIFYKEPFSYYRLRAKYRFVGDQCPGGPGWAFRNSGLMIHGQEPQTMGVDQDFPISIEVQLLGGNGSDPRTTANLCTPGTNVVMDEKLFTNHCINSSSATYHGDQWVTTEIVALGDSVIQHFVEGQEVLTYHQPQIGGGTVSGHDPAVKIDGQLLTGGSISLQSESHPVEYMTVELLNLEGCKDPKAKNYKSYIIKHDPGSCVY